MKKKFPGFEKHVEKIKNELNAVLISSERTLGAKQRDLTDSSDVC